MEPPHSYLQQASAAVVHHQDYLNHRQDHALCGAMLEAPTVLDAEPPDVCPDCEVKLVEYHAVWWRETALAAVAELEELRVRYRELAGEDTAADTEAPRQEAPVPDLPEPVTFLDRARKELLELCRQFDGAVPYFRLKNTMQAFSDRLGTDERVILAEEIGADGSLIRWCATEAERLGWTVTNSPVQAENELMWDAWTHDAYQAPKKTKWRLGRSRD
ncbi:hypothetical protein SAMN04489835_2738 [Mycolicibacterium rutilum]|uniref:Uncharacterized protein n=1 Tax=Mycolicibacterium rutilum TaxID=370526 RepID=A0A1H6K7H9_MYCRU|nr:hypothetical protein [Mycolicibacterium rutilum]SEH67414.1 hypothetical protein SAMN04489835_2738 [Mycolicibacterium rutilum]